MCTDNEMMRYIVDDIRDTSIYVVDDRGKNNTMTRMPLVCRVPN